MSWHTLGIIIKTAMAGGVLYAGGFVLALCFPENSVGPFLIMGGAILAVSGAIICSIIALVVLTGLVPIRCPICNSRSKLVGRGSYTFLHCPKCGNVHAKGFFRSRYVIDDGD